MVLAITGHIVHDLPLALIDVSPTDGPELARIHDFHAVNDIMQDAIELMEAEVSHRYGGGLDWIDQMAETYDQILTNYGIRMSRGLGWYNALRLADPKARTEARAAIEKSPTIVVENVLGSTDMVAQPCGKTHAACVEAAPSLARYGSFPSDPGSGLTGDREDSNTKQPCCDAVG